MKDLPEHDSNYEAQHYVHKSNWLRAAVLGANDGVISTSSIAVGVAAGSASAQPVILATIAGLVAGALSMAAGEYVSVSSQKDLEKADLEREQQELEDMPDVELHRLAKIYQKRGVKAETALEVAKQLTNKDALAAHAKDELGIDQMNQANPLQAAFASGLAFTLGGILPLLVTLMTPLENMVFYIYTITIIALILLGTASAKAGGSSVIKAIARITILGTLAMLLTAIVGHVFGVSV